ncbi:CENPP protein, partial [Amia calva]|nr:CENPP protein [Amia calva]
MDPQATSGFQNRENPQQMYEAEIRSLRAEIAVLEEQQESQEREVALHFGEHLQKALASLKGKSSDKRTGENETLANLKAGLENLEEDLALQGKINGIELTHCTVKTLEKSENKMTQQYRISGHCHFLAFQIEFELTEVEEEGIVSKSVTDLNIVVDGSEFTNISTFVSRAEDTKSLLLFLRTLKSFSDWCEHRRRTFLYFKEKYPEAVSLPEGCRAEQMAIKNPALPG